MRKKIAVLVGSLRQESYNRKMANVLISLAPQSLEMNIVEIGDLPFYNEDLDHEGKIPASWISFREQIKAADGVLFVTPEYNRSVPAVLKNAVDVGSRPYGQSCFSKKPTAVISVSIGTSGGFGANQHLRQCFVFLDMPTLQQPEAYISQANTLFDADGKLINEGTTKFLQQFIDAYADWVEKITL